ncbi:MAG: isoprenylcysteine carboxylmethyltransferase family protein [Ardenticatenaceae bacterium]|nr:isoprenylcysteine carboxylmethyltransferase family protein [Ardenticatenaceae bacterium]MCB9445826.1 isoprenylcysteine carboxylmethyltransferase family protein [Ardenticatenaceae bacterium]
MTTQTVTNNQDLKAGIIRRFVQIFISMLIQALVLFGAAGTLRWGAAWIFFGLSLAGIAVNAIFMRHKPEIIVERGRGTASGNWKEWDKVVGIVFGVFYFIGILLVAGLDERWGWTTTLTFGWQIVGIAGFVLGNSLFSWAMITNAYFSTAVRIQTDRGHQVCSSGPYRFVRHPGYVGASLQSLAMPLLFGSWWALIAAGTAVLLLIIRTALEDRTLHQELAGYQSYAQSVRFRLIPGVW